jgi:hypothetical protein
MQHISKLDLKQKIQSSYLTRIVASNKAAMATELDTTPLNIPADSAVNFLLNRKVQETRWSRSNQCLYLPALQRGVDTIQFYR